MLKKTTLNENAMQRTQPETELFAYMELYELILYEHLYRIRCHENER